MPSLAETLAEVRRRIWRVGTRSMNEANTKATLIDQLCVERWQPVGAAEYLALGRSWQREALSTKKRERA